MRAPPTLVLVIVAAIAVVAAMLMLRVDGTARSATVAEASPEPIILPPRPIAGRAVAR